MILPIPMIYFLTIKCYSLVKSLKNKTAHIIKFFDFSLAPIPSILRFQNLTWAGVDKHVVSML